MAIINPTLKNLITTCVVRPPHGVDIATQSRRQRLTWQVFDDKAPSKYRDVVASTERMNDRAAAGGDFSTAAMKRSERVQKAPPKSLKIKMVKPPKPQKPQKVVVAKATPATKVAAVKKQKVPNTAPVAPNAAEALKATLSTPPGGNVSTEPPGPVATHVILVYDESGSMCDQLRDINAQSEAIRKQLVAELPDAMVSVLRFGTYMHWDVDIKAAKLQPLNLNSSRGGTALYYATIQAVQKALLTSDAVLIYLLTNGGATDSDVGGATVAVTSALKTNRITFACVGPEMASGFFKGCGIPDACVRKWDGVDKAALAVVTQQAAQGVSNYAKATRAGKTKIDSFFVDVVAAGITVEKAKSSLRDLKALLRVRKINNFVDVKSFVEKELKLTLVPGAAYYQLQNATKLVQGRRIILQPRGQEVYLSGPGVRTLLGLPDDRDIKLEPKNLGDFVVYVQSASPTRRLLPGTTFLYDESHVAGATAPTWSYAAKVTV